MEEFTYSHRENNTEVFITMNSELIYGRIADALLCDYSSVYYVNAITNEYVSYAMDPEFRSLITSSEGENFFEQLKIDVERVVYEEDRHIFTEHLDKETLMREMKNKTMQNIVYRLMIDGKPVYHSLRLIRGQSTDDEYFILGVTNVDKEIRMELEAERLGRERKIYNQIAQSLASYYNTIYYVNAEDETYTEFSASTEYDELDIPKTGSDFFGESRKNAMRVVFCDDRERVLEIMHKEYITDKLKEQKIFSIKYRLLLGGTFKYTRLSAMWSSDKTHFIIGVENIDEQMKKELASKELEQKSRTYSQILNSLAYRYDSIYYVDIGSGAYSLYSATGESGALTPVKNGNDFFGDVPTIVNKLVYENDRKQVIETIYKENLLERLNNTDSFSLRYKHLINGSYSYVNLRVAWAEDKCHIILGIANIDDQVKLENKYKNEIISATAKAMNDKLTGVKNKNAYQETESALQSSIDKGSSEPFAVLICDLNDLKIINDTLGHKAGDDYICAACHLICSIFTHSPVYRIGGDEFAVILREYDHQHKEELFEELRRQVLENCSKNDAPVLASGLAEYEPTIHKKVSEVFELADSRMYANKKELKQLSH
jgi:diguanylate cyclase (GGDEF)-like protein